MKIIKCLICSSVGKKFLMALTGFSLFAFVFIHLLGNLQIYFGRDMINSYAALLKANHMVLWSFRIGLTIIALIHILTGITLWFENRKARPIKYEMNILPYADLASRTMVFGGLTLFVFIIYHLMHFTVGLADPQIIGHIDYKGRADVYSMVVMGFKSPLSSIVYIFALFFLFLHLKHGLESMFQSVGLRNTRFLEAIKWFAKSFAMLIFIVMGSIPLAVMFGFLKY